MISLSIRKSRLTAQETAAYIIPDCIEYCGRSKFDDVTFLVINRK
ncbi:hypothetical protein LEP1GSC060_0576 [Leptospira weilii serovar Ranarum str. ICFT]|uniref:Uncharacterized protein n=1 Tax=Leptospira weilii serovar Ranarum str. ICFT TaxID=1218598 RepID=N1WSA3_9LEPT|nr:hypothetical protein LEP1GSC060_0576 [Leptospira weilii serovar Ranarum str. ICFT]